MRIREMLMRFFAGRYGSDTLNHTLLVLYFLLWIVNIFAQSTIIQLLSTALIFYILFRMLSRNTYARSRENVAFLRVFGGRLSKIKRRAGELKDSTHIYKSCPNCKARLRLPRRKGTHTARCPKCNTEFKVHSIYN